MSKTILFLTSLVIAVALLFDSLGMNAAVEVVVGLWMLICVVGMYVIAGNRVADATYHED